MAVRYRPEIVLTLLTLAVFGLTVAPVGLASPQSAAGELTRGEPSIDVYLPDDELSTGTGGEAATLTFVVQNDGELAAGTQRERVTTARGVVVEVDDPGPLDVTTGPTPVGSIEEGSIAEVPFSFDVPADIEPGEYDVTVDVSYSYTRTVSDGSGVEQERSTTESVDVTVRVTKDDRFEIVNASTDVEPGGTGDAIFEVQNVGDEWTNQTRGTITPTGEGALSLDGGAAEVFLGDLAPGQITTVTVDAAVDAGVSDGPKPVEAAFTYEDESGIEQDATPVTTSLPLVGSQSFTLDAVEDTLAVGYDGEITGEITNDGPRSVDDAVLIAEPTSDSLHVEDTRYALPELAPGETTTFRFPTDVGGSADPGPRQVQFSVEYTSGDGTITDGPMNERVVVDDQRDEFSLEPVSTTVTAGEREAIVLEITNERPETLSNIDAMVYTNDPLDAPNEEAFVSELAPGESAEIVFEIEADADASIEAHPIEVDFEYRTERGETTLSDAYVVGIDVVEGNADDGGLFSFGFATTFVVLVTLASGAIGVTVWRRRD